MNECFTKFEQTCIKEAALTAEKKPLLLAL